MMKLKTSQVVRIFLRAQLLTLNLLFAGVPILFPDFFETLLARATTLPSDKTNRSL